MFVYCLEKYYINYFKKKKTMKRFSYILAALLAGGATTALTSCIDTTEPAGITELRGAKAMLLKAKAAFIDAKTQREAVYLEQDKVQLESQKVDLELKKLNLELQKTLNAIKNDSANMAHKLYLETIQKKRDSLALRAEQDWWKVQKDITTAEKNYKKAIVDLQVALLTYKDEAIATKIEAYTKELYGDNWNSTSGSPSSVLTGGLYELLNQANLDLVKAQREKVLFTAKTDDYLNSLNLTKTKEEKILKIQQDLLARMKELSTKFAQDSLQAVKERIIEIDDAIAKLDKKKVDLYTEIKNMRRTNLASVSEKLAEYDATLNKDTAFVMDIVDEKLQNDLGQELATTYRDAFEKDADDNTKYVMKAAIEIKKDASSADLTLRNMKNLDAVVGSSGILSTIQDIYQGQYLLAYKQYVDASFSSLASELFEADGKTVKGVYAAQLKNELERLELDEDELRQDCKDAQDKWLKTYETLSKALDAYKGYKDPSAKYKAAKEAIDKYLEATDGLSATGTADEKAKYLELSKKLRDQLVKDYYTYREPIDSVSSDYVNNFKKDYIDKDAAGKDQLTEANMVAFRSNFVYGTTSNYSLLGVKDFNSTSAVEGSALYEFLKAENDLFGSGATSLAKALQPEKVDGKFVAPAGINAESYIADGSIYGSKIDADSKFYKAAKTYEKNRPVILTTLADWVSLYDKIDGQMDQVADRVDGLIAAKKALVNDNKDAYTAIWEKEIECYLIDAQITIDLNGDGSVNADDGDVTNLFDENNPYYANYIKDDQGKDDDELQDFVKPDASLSEKGILQTEKNLLTNYADNNSIVYVKYDEATGAFIATESKTWEELIDLQEGYVEDAQEDVDNVQQRIDLLTELGYMESNTDGTPDYTTDVTISSTVGDNDQYTELLDKKIEHAQDKVNILKAEFDRIQAKIQDLIKAAEDADFGSSDATYPGFDIDNDAIEVPGTDEPEPENPEPENPEPENPEPENPQPENPQPENPQPENPQPENPDTDKPAE